MIAIGQPFVQVGDSYVRGPDGSRHRRREWHGTAAAVQANLATLENGVARIGDTIESDFSGPVCSLVHITSDTPYSDQYQVQVTVEPNIVQKSIFEPPLPDRYGILDANDIAAIKDALNEDNIEDALSTLLHSSPAITLLREELFFTAKAGVEYRVVYQQILTKTTVAPSDTRFLYSYSNVGRILSTSSLLVDLGLDESILRFTLPNESYAGDGIDARYGWLKIYPAVQLGSQNATVLTQQYQYGLWLTTLYDYVG